MALDLLLPEIDSAMTLWRYMKVSTFFLLPEGTAFLPSVATLQNVDPLEGDLHPEPEWLVGKLEDLSKGKFSELKAARRDWTALDRELPSLDLFDKVAKMAGFFAAIRMRMGEAGLYL